MKSESIKELATALSKAQGEFDHAKKDVDNAYFKSKYADLASCIDAAKKQLAANGLSVIQTTDFEADSVYLETTLMHSSGEWINSRYPIKPIKPDPQSFGSALTYARRYCFCAITGLASDDDDGNAASDKKNSTGQAKESKSIPSQEPAREVNYRLKLENASTIAELLAEWQLIPKNRHSEFLGIKNIMKDKLTSKAA